MHSEELMFKPCCFCLCNFITWRCFKMVITALLLMNFILTLVEIVAVVVALENMYYIDDVSISAMIVGVLSLDFVMHITFIFGTYKKNLKFFRMYYFYTECVLILTSLQGFVCFCLLFCNRFGYSTIIFPLLLVFTFFVYLLIQIYVLLLVRREIAKLETLDRTDLKLKIL